MSKFFKFFCFYTYMPIVLFSINPAFADKCLFSDEQRTQIQEELKQLTHKKESLINFTNGELLKDESLESLFGINLSDESQIKNRISEINQNLKAQVELECQESDFGDVLKKRQIIEREINSLLLNILILPLKQRDALIALHVEANRNQEEFEKAKEAKLTAQQNIETANKAIKKAEKLSKDSNSTTLKDLAFEIAEIEKFRKSVAESKSNISDLMSKLTSESKLQTQKLGEFASILNKQDTSIDEIEQVYSKVLNLWRKIVDDVVKDNQLGIESEKNLLPKYSSEIFEKAMTDGFVEESRNYENSYQSAKKEFKVFNQSVSEYQNYKKESRFRELVLVGQIRSQFLRMLEDKGVEKFFKLSDSYINDLFREIKLIPYRPAAVFVSVLKKVKETGSRGIEGIIELIEKSFILSIFFIIPLLALFLIRKGLNYLELHKRTFFKKSSNSNSLLIFTWVHRLRPYLPWVALLFAFYLSKSLVKGTDLENMAELLPYFSSYIVYRLFRVVVDSNLVKINSFSGSKLTSMTRKRIERTSKFLGLFFLLSFYLLETTAAVARRALFYRFVLDILFWFCPLVLSLSAYIWRKEIKIALKQLLNSSDNEKFLKFFDPPYAFVTSLPAALFIVLSSVFNRVKEELLEVDSIKSISAQLFRKKIEANIGQIDEASRKEIKSSYRRSFSSTPLIDDKFIVKHQSFVLDELKKMVLNWSENLSDERTVAVFGEMGIGKSSILNNLANMPGDFEIIKTSVKDRKITTSEGIKQFLQTECQMNLNEELNLEDAFNEYNHQLKNKKLIIIDNGQNLFLGHRKGFRSFRTFMSILTQNCENIFWCVSFNHFSWSYLNFVTNGSQYFRKVFKIQPWSDEEIKELIIKRHRDTDYELEFDPIIFAVGPRATNETYQYLEERFFELLWEQSKGNPQTAMALWLSSLIPFSSKKFRVGLPGGHIQSKIEGLIDEQLFVIAAIVKHENLTVSQATKVTGIEKAIVQHAIRIGVDRGFLYESDCGSFRVTAIWQPTVIKTLSGKNLLYG